MTHVISAKHCTWRYYSNLLEYIPHRLFSAIVSENPYCYSFFFSWLLERGSGFVLNAKSNQESFRFQKWASTICDIRLNFDECYLSSSSNVISSYVRAWVWEIFLRRKILCLHFRKSNKLKNYWNLKKKLFYIWVFEFNFKKNLFAKLIKF